MLTRHILCNVCMRLTDLSPFANAFSSCYLNHHHEVLFSCLHEPESPAELRSLAKGKAREKQLLFIEQCIIIFATLAFHAMKIYCTSLSPSLVLRCLFLFEISPNNANKVFKGIQEKKCNAKRKTGTV